jgi:hypothetical protein
MDLDHIPSLEVMGNRFRADPGPRNLTVGILGIDELDVERKLSMDADRLYFLHQARFRPLQHVEHSFPERREPKDSRKYVI